MNRKILRALRLAAVATVAVACAKGTVAPSSGLEVTPPSASPPPVVPGSPSGASEHRTGTMALRARLPGASRGAFAPTALGGDDAGADAGPADAGADAGANDAGANDASVDQGGYTFSDVTITGVDAGVSELHFSLTWDAQSHTYVAGSTLLLPGTYVLEGTALHVLTGRTYTAKSTVTISVNEALVATLRYFAADFVEVIDLPQITAISVSSAQITPNAALTIGAVITMPTGHSGTVVGTKTCTVSRDAGPTTTSETSATQAVSSSGGLFSWPTMTPDAVEFLCTFFVAITDQTTSQIYIESIGFGTTMQVTPTAPPPEVGLVEVVPLSLKTNPDGGSPSVNLKRLGPDTISVSESMLIEITVADVSGQPLNLTDVVLSSNCPGLAISPFTQHPVGGATFISWNAQLAVVPTNAGSCVIEVNVTSTAVGTLIAQLAIATGYAPPTLTVDTKDDTAQLHWDALRGVNGGLYRVFMADQSADINTSDKLDAIASIDSGTPSPAVRLLDWTPDVLSLTVNDLPSNTVKAFVVEAAPDLSGLGHVLYGPVVVKTTGP